MIAALCLFLVSLAAITLEQNPEDLSPCPHVFMYGPSRAKPGRWYGVVTLSTEITLHSLWLNIVLDNEAWVLGNSVGNVTTQDNKNFQIENAVMRINPGVAEVLYFYVQYNPSSVTPRLLAIRLNGKEICNFILTPVKKPFKPPHKDVSNINDKPTYTYTETQIQYQGNNNPRDPQGQVQCGEVVNGAHMGEQWPWQIALYKVHETNEDNKYICGGTLVSDRHVITAAHCVTRKSTKRIVELHTLTVYLGKQNLRTTVDGVQIGFVKEIIVHPNYNASTFSSDVAILELNPMAYTEWVRPACLWPKHDTDIKKIVGKEGTLVGWVFDDGGQVINDLVQEKSPIVSQERCIGSYNSFFGRYTSEYTYCAGNRKETSTCPSAGSGMVFKNGNAWYIRGLVSLSVPKLNAFQCDPKHYTIFTDLAKFSSWISSITKI